MTSIYKSVYFFTFLLFAIPYVLYSQKVGWEKVIGDSANQERTYSRTIIKTTDGGYIITGSKSYLANPRQLYLLQIDSIGNIIRDSTFGIGEGYDILPTKDGEYFIGGYGSSKGFMIIKVNSNWDTMWTKNFPDNNNLLITHIYEASDKSYLLTGATRPDDSITVGNMSVIKVDSNGNQIWANTYGSPYPIQEEGRCIYELSSGKYLFLGLSYNLTNTVGELNSLLVCTNNNGDTLWTKTLYGGGGSMIKSSNDNFILAGSTHQIGGGSDLSDIFLSKLDENWNTLFTIKYGKNYDDGGNTVMQLNNNDIIIFGLITDYPGDRNIFLLKTDSLNNLLWQKTYGGVFEEWPGTITQTNEGGFLLVGSSKSFGAESVWSDIYFIKTDSNGCIVIPEASFTASDTANAGFPFSFTNTSFTDTSLSIKTLTYQWLVNGALYDTTKNLNTQFVTPGNYLITLIADNGNCQDTAYKTITVTIGMENIDLRYPYLGNSIPNPANNIITINFYVPVTSADAEIIIYNTLGSIIRKISLPTGNAVVSINKNELEPGFYFYSLKVDGKIIDIKKMIIAR